MDALILNKIMRGDKSSKVEARANSREPESCGARASTKSNGAESSIA